MPTVTWMSFTDSIGVLLYISCITLVPINNSLAPSKSAASCLDMHLHFIGHKVISCCIWLWIMDTSKDWQTEYKPYRQWLHTS